MSIKKITNYIQVSKCIASSGQPTSEQFKDIAQNNYQVVINLAMPNSDQAIVEEGNIVAALDMVYIHIPVPFDAPTKNHLHKFIGIMEVFSSQKIWVHCVVNYRASAFLYQYQRLICGITSDDAKKIMLPSWKPNEVWQNFLEISNSDFKVNTK
jgi:protein tyrosine phosphatase (PTP) superfamily phosphohydrolase (DUF442 family)